jgi:glycogen(starch) synthase
MSGTGSGTGRPLSVLRLCSVFEPPETDADEVEAQAAFDPIGGMQNHTANLTRALDAQGVRQTVITSRLGGDTSDTTFGRSARIIRVGFPTTRLRQLWAWGAARQVLRAGPVDLVHAHQGEDLAALPLGILAARRFRLPLVVTLHCSVAHTVPAAGLKLAAMRAFGGPLETACLHAADRVIALTDATAERLGGLRARTVVIPSGVEPERFRVPPSTLFADVPGPVVLYLGRLARQKDVPTLVRAFGRLRTPASLVVIGDGPDHARVDAAVAALPADVRNRVHRFGFRPHTEVPALLAAADLVVLPSIYEEMGSILAEALQAGRPVVATRVGGIPSVVEDGQTGLLVPPSDPPAMAAAIDRLLGDRALLSRLGEQSLVAAADYDWTTLGKSVRDVYDAALTAAACSSRNRSADR